MDRNWLCYVINASMITVSKDIISDIYLINEIYSCRYHEIVNEQRSDTKSSVCMKQVQLHVATI